MGRVRIFASFKSCGFRGSLFLIIFLLLTIGILFSPVSSQAYEDDLEKDLRNSLSQSRTIVIAIQNKLASRNAQPGSEASITSELSQLKTIAENVRITDLLMEERFKLREEKAKTLGSNALARHQAMVEGYRAALTEYLSLVDSLPAESRQYTVDSSQETTISKLKALLDKLLPKRKRPIIGSLPYKHLNYPSREPSAAPAITPAYRGGNKTLSPDDTRDTPEAPINKEIATLAQSLNWNPVSIYEYVKNTVETEWYWGCMKGAEETLRQKSGNDCDQATLLTALLRASGFPTRYVRGTIEFFPNIERAKNLTGISDPLKIAEFFRKSGIPYTPVIGGGTIANIQIEHIWVESQIPYANYRGAIIDEHGKTWLGLDTSIKVKDYVYNTPKDLFQEPGARSQLEALRDEYLGAVQTLTPLEYLQSFITSQLATSQPGTSYSDFLLTRTLPEERMNILPAGMQFVEKSITGEYIEIPDDLKHKVRFVARTTQNSELLNFELDLMKLSNQQIAISYEPETVEDQEIINSWGGLGNTPAYLVRLRPVLKVGGQRSAVGIDGLPMGSEYDFTIELISPNGKETIDNTQVTGNLTTVGIVAQKSAVDTKIQEGDDAETILFKEANAYINRWNQAEEELASLFHLRIARPLPAVVTVGGVIDVTYLMDTPHGFTWKGVFIDADMKTIEAVRSEAEGVRGEAEKTFMQLSSLQGSILENRVFEDDFQVESISTAKLIGIVRASQPPAEILTIDSTNIDAILPTIPFEQNVKDDIINSVNQNLIVRIPAQELTHENWAGTGYIKEHPDTGESGYMLSGMIAGGMTAWSLDRWSAVLAGILSNTYAEPANYDPASARYIQKIVATDMENGLVGDPLPQPLQVKVTDSSHQPVTGALVTFTRKAGGGSLSGTDAEGNQVAGTSITVPTNPSGIASARLTLGISTASNPTFMKLLDSHNQIYGEAIQVGENIVDAALASGTGIAAPFTAYGFPKGPHHMNKLFGDGYWSAVLSFAGYLKVGIEDVHNNPVSNVKLNFTVSDPVPNPDYSACTVQNSRPAYLIPQGTACVNDIPAWGTCGDTSAQTLPVTSGSTGALAYVVLGSMPQALYTIQVTCVNPADPGLCTDPATGQPFKTTFTLKTFPWGNCSGYESPYDVIVGMYVEPVDSYGMNINAGKTGTTIPLQTKLYYLEEGDTTVNFTYTGCSDGTMTCPLIVGTKQYTIDTGSGPDTKFTSSKVTFTPQGGSTVVVTAHDNNGLYRTQHVLTSGINTITVEGTATIQRDKSNNTCNGCGTLPNQPITQNVMSIVEVYGVDVQVASVLPILINEDGYPNIDHTITYTINPPEYKANTAYVMVYKDGEYIAAIQGEKQRIGTAVIAKGFRFDQQSTYEAEVILNYGTGVEIKSDKVKIPVVQIQVKKNVLPDTVEEIKYGNEDTDEKTYHIKLKSTSIRTMCDSLMGKIRVLDKHAQPLSILGQPNELYPSEYPLSFELSFFGLGSECLVSIVDTANGGTTKRDFIVSNQPQAALTSGSKAILYGGIGSQLEIEINGMKKYMPIEPVGIIVLGIDGLRQDVLYPAEEQQVNDTSGNYYVQPSELRGLCDVLGGKTSGILFTSCDTQGYEKKHIKLPKVTAIFPSITLASWASIFTGVQSGKTGILGNEFFDRNTMKMISLDGGAFPATTEMLKARYPLLNLNHAAGIGIADNLLQTVAADGSKVQTVYEAINDIKPGLKSVVFMHNYSRGATEWHYQDDLADWLYLVANGLAGNEDHVSQVMDSSPVNDAVFYTNSFANSLSSNKKFPVMTSIYMAGLDHYAHAFGLGAYRQFFTDNTDKGIANIVEALKDAGEFDNKIFMIVADHGHTQMPTFADVTLPDGRVITPDTSCKLNVKNFRYNDVQEAEKTNNNLHIWELANLFAQFPDPNIDMRVLAPPQVAKLADLAKSAISDINQANIIAALNGPMAHIYIKGADWQSNPNMPLFNSVLVNLHKIMKVGDSATGKLAEKITKHFPRLSSSIDVILMRNSLTAEYVVVQDIGEDAQGNVVVTSVSVNEYFAGHPEYIKAVNRITGMNHPNRSGDIVLMMKDATAGNALERFTTGVACKSWHGSLNPSDSYVPFIASYPGGNKLELDAILNTVCPNNACIGNWKLSDLVKEIVKTEYSGQ